MAFTSKSAGPDARQLRILKEMVHAITKLFAAILSKLLRTEVQEA